MKLAFSESELKAIIPIKHDGVKDTVSLLSIKDAQELFSSFDNQKILNK